MKVNWNSGVHSPALKFNDLKVGDTFRNRHGRGAVYAKVQNKHTYEEFMLEIATGLLFAPTTSDLELVHVDVNVDSAKPTLYR